MDRSAQIVAASSTVIPTPKFQTESFFFRYLRELKRQKAQFDAISVHLYPVNPRQGPDARVASIEAVRRVMRTVGLKKQLWDTEVNYGDRRTATNQVVPKFKKGGDPCRTHVPRLRAVRPRPYLLVRLGYRRAGISMTNPDGSSTRAGQAFLTMSDWLSGQT